MERALVSYDDIQPGPIPSLPQPPVAGPSVPTGPNQQQGQPPRKKRRNNKQNRGGGQNNNNNAHVQNSNVNVNGFNAGYAGNGWGNRQPQMHAQAHWDDPMHAGYPPQLPPHPQPSYTQPQHLPPKPQTSLPAKPLPTQPRAMQVEQDYIGGEEEEGYAEEEYQEGGEEEEGEGEMSRMLSREEVWDDSALIDAWEAATAEYEAMHGKSKDWKNEPVKKSALWYNVPPKPTKGKSKEETAPAENSQPFDFDTFVPSHDASAYNLGAVAGDGEVAWVSRDAAFEQALNATYWAGYWTAVYHSHNRANASVAENKVAKAEEAEGEYAGEEGDEDDEAVIASPIDEDIIPTQR